MPRFFFNVRDGRDMVDDEGADFADWHGARQYAVRHAGRILDDEADRLALGETWCMEACDATGLIVFRLNVNVSPAPVLAGRG